MLDLSDQLRRHAEWVEDQMRPLDLPTDVSRSTGPVPTGVERTDRNRRASRRVWLAVAVAALVALVAGSLAVMRTRPGQPTSTAPAATPPDLIATGHDSVLLPRSTPDGLMAVDVATSTPAGRSGLGLQPTGPVTTQLFGVDQQPQLEVRIEPSATGADQDSGTDQTVRGTPGKLLAAGQPTVIRQPNGSSYYQQSPTNDRYTWYERGSFITANFRDLAPAQVLDIIDAMQWASADRADGFELAIGAGLTSLFPATSEPSSGIGLEADVKYLVQPGETKALQLVTCPAGTAGCPSATFDYATAWLNGTRAADGSVTVSVDGHSGQPFGTHGTYLQIWPDGATIQVDFGESTVDPDLARRLTADIGVTDRSGLDGLNDEISSGLRSLPLMAGADLTGGRVELRGAGQVSVACLTPVAAPQTCGSAHVTPEGGLAPTVPINASAMVNGHWIVGAATTNPGPIAFAAGDTVDFDHPAGPPLSGQTATVTVGSTTYQLGLVEVPDDVTGIMLTQSTPGSIGGGSVERPTS